MRQPLIAGNWKMNTTTDEAIALVKELSPELDNINNTEKLVCPPFISLVAVHKALVGSTVKVGAQNMYFEEKGAYTGEISPLMLAGICEYVIIGHSERRQYFRETGQMLSKKIAAAIRHNIRPILCVGENLGEYEAGQTQEVVSDQLKSSLAGVEKGDTLTIAYEPVWAIGTGKAATGIQANETIQFTRTFIAGRFSSRAADDIRILYGGSVTASNIAEFVAQPEIDGALVGGASLKAKEFSGIVRVTSQIRK